MTGIVINNNEYTVSTGSTKIEYSSTGDTCGYSIYGEDIPFTPIIREFSFTSDATNVHIPAGNYVICVISGGASGQGRLESSSYWAYNGSTGRYLVIHTDLEEGNYDVIIGTRGAAAGPVYDKTSKGYYSAGYNAGGNTCLRLNNTNIIYVPGASDNGNTGDATFPSGSSLVANTFSKGTNDPYAATMYTGSYEVRGRRINGIAGFTDYNNLVSGTFGGSGGAYAQRTGNGQKYATLNKAECYAGQSGLLTMRKIG